MLCGRARLGSVVQEGSKSSNLVKILTKSLRAAILDHNTISKPCPCALEARDYKENKQLKMMIGDQNHKCRVYAPQVFRQLRHQYNIDDNSFLDSLCPMDGAPTEISTVDTGSKSGQRFYISHDGRYFMKTMTASEAKRFRKVLPEYFQHMKRNRGSLLCRFFGLLRLRKPYSMYVVIMNNVFDTDRDIHERYDLKGSSVGRFATPDQKASPTCVLKDFDFIARAKKVEIGEQRKTELLKQIKKDCDFLESLGMMDYSLLLGVHARQSDPLSRESPLSRSSPFARVPSSFAARRGSASAHCSPQRGPKEVDACPPLKDLSCELPESDGLSPLGRSAEPHSPTHLGICPEDERYEAPWARYEQNKPKFRQENACDQGMPWGESMEDELVQFKLLLKCSPHASFINDDGKVIMNGSLDENALEKCPSHTAWFQKSDGGLASSQRILVQKASKRRDSGALCCEAGDEVYFVGIIDFLQKYTVKKRLETSWRSILKPKSLISCVDPKQYSSRFRKFVSDIVD